MNQHHAFGRMATFFLAVVLVAGGCGSDPASPPTGLSQGEADDFAVSTMTSLQLIGGDLEAVLGGTPLAASAPARVRPARALFDTTYVWNGITWEASRTYYDAADQVLASYGPTAVRVHWTSRAYGTTEGQRDTSTIGRSGVLDVGGIHASQDTLKLNGTSRDSLFIKFRSLDNTRMRYFYWTSLLVIDNVPALKSSLQTGFRPLSGTVTLAISADRLRSYNLTDVEAHLDVVVVITFDGSQYADLVVNGRYRYRWNVDSSEVTRA
jgi:hypothetical protein